MGTKAMLAVALTTVVAVSAVDTFSLAEAGGAARDLRGRNSAHAQPSNVVRSGGAATKGDVITNGPVVTAKDNDKPAKGTKPQLQNDDRMGNMEIQVLMSN